MVCQIVSIMWSITLWQNKSYIYLCFFWEGEGGKRDCHEYKILVVTCKLRSVQHIYTYIQQKTWSQFTGMWHPKLNPVHLDSGLKDFFFGGEGVGVGLSRWTKSWTHLAPYSIANSERKLWSITQSMEE